MLALYRALAVECHGRGKELWIGLQLGRNTQFTVDPHWSTHAVVRYANHWQTLVAEGIADAFILGDYELGSQPAHPYCSLKTDLVLAPGQSLYAWAAGHYREYCRDRTKLYLFSEWLPDDAGDLDRRLAFFADAVRRNGFDGIDVHEAANFESSPEHIATLGRMAERLRTAIS
jgi:hypothetical protein